ncbi:MAG: hypothetical protein AAFY34_12145 [Pseudomonadota bacterium]
MMHVRFPLSLRNVEDLLDEMFANMRGETHHLSRAVDHEGKVLESYITESRNMALYGAAMKEIGNVAHVEVDRHLNTRAKNCLLPFRRREKAILRFRRMRSLQKSTSMHSSVYNHFNHQRNIESRAKFRSLRDPALPKWRELITV